MSGFYDWVSLESMHAPRFDKRFVRTPMGIYYVANPSSGGFKVSEEEAATIREEARELLRYADENRPRTGVLKAYWSLYTLIIPLVSFATIMSMFGLGKLVSFFVAPFLLLNLVGPTIMSQFTFTMEWRRFLQMADARFGDRVRTDFAIIAPYYRRNPVEIVSWWLTGIAVSIVLGLIAASLMLDEAGEDALMAFVGQYAHWVGIGFVLLYLGTVGYDRYFGTHADRPPQSGADLMGRGRDRGF